MLRSVPDLFPTAKWRKSLPMSSSEWLVVAVLSAVVAALWWNETRDRQ